MSEVAKLKPRTEREESSAQIGMVVEFSLGEGHSLQFATHVQRDDSPSDINATLDKVMAAGERQKNRSMLAQCRRNVVIREREISKARAQLAEAEKRHASELIEREEARETYKAEIARIEALDSGNFAASSKRGDYKRSVDATKAIQPLVSQISRLDEDQKAQDRVRDDVRKSSSDSIREHELNIDWMQEEIARYQKALEE